MKFDVYCSGCCDKNMATSIQQVLEDIQTFSSADKMRRKPVHGKLFLYPSEIKRHDVLQDMAITGKQMSLPQILPSTEDIKQDDSYRGNSSSSKKSSTDLDVGFTLNHLC